MRAKLIPAAGVAAIVTSLWLGTGTALAYTLRVKSSVVCNTQTGMYEVLWTVRNKATEFDMNILSAELGGIGSGAVLFAPNPVPKGVRVSHASNYAGTTVGEITLTVEVQWADGFVRPPQTATVTLAGDCVQVTPTPTPTPMPTPMPTPTPSPTPVVLGTPIPPNTGNGGSLAASEGSGNAVVLVIGLFAGGLALGFAVRRGLRLS